MIGLKGGDGTWVVAVDSTRYVLYVPRGIVESFRTVYSVLGRFEAK